MDAVVVGVALALAGVVIGIFSGMLGIGGGTVMVPLLRIAFGFPAISATATSLFVIIPTSVSGALSHLRRGTCLVKLGLALGLGGAISSSLGVFLADRSPSWAIMLVAAVVIAYSAATMLRKAIKLPKKGEASANAASPSAVTHSGGEEGNRAEVVSANAASPSAVTTDSDEVRLSGKALLGGVGIGLVAGFASGYVGVGGGFIMVPLMTSLLHIPIRKASGTSLVAIIILAIPSVIEYCLLGHVDYLAGVMLTIGTIPGAVLGTKLGTMVNERVLRFIFAGFLGIAAVLLVVREFAF